MITVEELKLQFGVSQVLGRGPCIVIPKGNFNVGWEQPLRSQNVDIEFNVDLRGGTYTVLRLKPEHLGERVVYSPDKETPKAKRQQPIAPWQDPERRWKPEEDDYLIELWNRGLILDEIEKEVLKRFPKRDKGVIQRLNRLKKAGKISSRHKRRSPREGFDFKMKHSNEVIEFARQLARQTDPAYSTRDIAKKIEEKFNIKVSNVAIMRWLKKSEHATPSTPVSTPVHTPKEPEKALGISQVNAVVNIQLNVNCNDRNAVTNFLEIIEKIGLKTRQETS